MNQVPFQRPEDLPATFGRYRVLKLLGQGGMGAVYLATDTQLDRPVALKIPHFEANDGSQVLERFQREARAAATILHPNVCPLHEVGEIDGVPYLTMSYIEGKPLSAFVAAKPLQPRQGALLVRKLALALAEAHKRGVIHRDLKPANVMIDRRSEPIIMDFGLARRARTGDPRLTQMGTTMGTPAYMPPEQVNGDVKAMGPACDIYSLGVILYELLTGRLPFSGDAMALLSQVLLDEPPPPSQFRPGLDPDLEAICLKAMAKKIPDRYASMMDLATALQGYLRTKNPAAEPLLPVVPQVKTPVPGPTAATLKPGFKPNPVFNSPEERDAFLGAETLKPGLKVRAQGEQRPLAALVADTPPNKPPKKTDLASRLTATVGGVPLWVWITGAAAAVVPVMFVALLLLLLRNPPDTGVAQGPASTKPEPTDPEPMPTEPGTIAFRPSEPAPGVEVKVDGVAAPSWGEPLQLSVGEHEVEVIGKEFMPFQQKFTVQSGQNATLRLELFRRALAPAKLIVPCDRTGTFELYLMNPDGSAPVQLTKPDNGAFHGAPTWSPDGKQIAFTASHHVYTMNVEDHKVTQLTSGVWEDYWVDWSVDGQLVIGSQQVGKSVIHVMNADGSNQATKLTPDGVQDFCPAWSPDGKKIAFASKRDGQPGFSLYVMDADGKHSRQIAKMNVQTSLLAPAWHPDGKRIAYVETVSGPAFEIFVIDLDCTNRMQLTKLGGNNLSPAWNPDGKQIAFLHNTTALYVLNVRTTPEYGLLNPDIYPPPEKMLEEKAISRPAWKPREFLDKPAEYGTIQFEPSEPAPQVELTVDGVAGYSWGKPLRLTPGDHFVGTIGKEYLSISRLFTVKPGRNPTLRVALAAAPPPVSAQPFRLLVCVENKDVYDLFLMNADGSDKVKLWSVECKPVSLAVPGVPSISPPGVGSFPPDPVWSPDGKEIAFLSTVNATTYNILVRNAEDKKVTQVFTNEDVPHSWPAWSVEGKVAFNSYHSPTNGAMAIYVMNTDGAKRVKLTPEGAVDLYPAWSPDGKQIAFASQRDGSKTWHLYVMDADGKNTKEITHEDKYVNSPTWSPDGKKIAFTQGVGAADEIFTIDLDGSNRKQLTKDGARKNYPIWTPDGKQIAYDVELKGVYLLNADGSGEPKEIFKCETKMGRPAWKPSKLLNDKPSE